MVLICSTDPECYSNLFRHTFCIWFWSVPQIQSVTLICFRHTFCILLSYYTTSDTDRWLLLQHVYTRQSCQQRGTTDTDNNKKAFDWTHYCHNEPPYLNVYSWRWHCLIKLNPEPSCRRGKGHHMQSNRYIYTFAQLPFPIRLDLLTLPRDPLPVVAGSPRDPLQVVAGSPRDQLQVVAGSSRDQLQVVAGSPMDQLQVVTGSSRDQLQVVARSPREPLPSKCSLMGALMITQWWIAQWEYTTTMNCPMRTQWHVNCTIIIVDKTHHQTVRCNAQLYYILDIFRRQPETQIQQKFKMGWHTTCLCECTHVYLSVSVSLCA